MATLLAPARRASVFLFILGGLLVPCGLLALLCSVMVNSASIPPESVAQMELAKEQAASLGFTLSGLFGTFAASTGIPGILFIVLGVIIRRGGMGSSVVSIICGAVLCLAFGFFGLGGLAASAQGAPGGLAMGCVCGLLLVLAVVLIVFSIQAARNAGRITDYRMAYQSHMQQYPQHPGVFQPPHPSQQPQAWQQPPGQWNQPAWPPQQQPPQPPSQNWPPPPSNPS
jgi:hypothetical protein